jgi:hypothetical protein
MANVLIQLAGFLSAICGLVVINFLLIIFVTIKRLGGSLERKHVIVIGTVAALFFAGGAALTYIASVLP